MIFKKFFVDDGYMYIKVYVETKKELDFCALHDETVKLDFLEDDTEYMDEIKQSIRQEGFNIPIEDLDFYYNSGFRLSGAPKLLSDSNH